MAARLRFRTPFHRSEFGIDHDGNRGRNTDFNIDRGTSRRGGASHRGGDSGAAAGRARAYSLLGVRITDLARQQALLLLSSILQDRTGPTRTVSFVNAHTLNLAAADPSYRDVLQGVRLRLRRRHRGPLGRPAARHPRARQPRRHRPRAAIAPRDRRSGLSLFPPRRQRTARSRGPPPPPPEPSRAGPPRATITVFSSTANLTADVIRRINDARPRVASGGHGQSAPGAMDPRTSPSTRSAAVHRGRRLVPLLGRRPPPRAPLVTPLGRRMAGNPLPTAAQGSPLLAGQSAVPVPHSPRAACKSGHIRRA